MLVFLTIQNLSASLHQPNQYNSKCCCDPFFSSIHKYQLFRQESIKLPYGCVHLIWFDVNKIADLLCV